MEITKREDEILDFIRKFKYCKIEHIQAFVDCTKSASNRIKHLLWVKDLFVENGVITTQKKIDYEEKTHMLKVLDVASELKNQNKICNVEKIDQPYFACARTKKGIYVYFAIIPEGRENITLKLIDNFNKGNTILILENIKQLKFLEILSTPVTKIIIYDRFLRKK